MCVSLIWLSQLEEVGNEKLTGGEVFGLPNGKLNCVGSVLVQIAQIQAQTIGAVWAHGDGVDATLKMILSCIVEIGWGTPSAPTMY